MWQLLLIRVNAKPWGSENKLDTAPILKAGRYSNRLEYKVMIRTLWTILQIALQFLICDLGAKTVPASQGCKDEMRPVSQPGAQH